MNDDVLQAVALAITAKVPVLLWGGPGTGKTTVVRSLADEFALPCEVVIAAIRDPTDFAGLPVVGTDGVSLAPPQWATRLAAAGRGLLFLDEISTAPPAVQAALLRVVLERQVGELALPDDVVIVAAANPPEQAADGWDLAAPLANRFCHVDWVIDATTWVEGMVGGFRTRRPPAIDRERLPDARREARALVASFVRSRTMHLYRPPDDAAQAGRAWPSPRTWTMAAELLAVANVAGSSRGATLLVLAGAVGVPAATELLTWMDDGGLPDPEDVLRDPDGLVLPERTDRVYATLASIAAAVAANPTAERWEAAWRAIGKASGTGHADVAVSVVRTLVRLRPDGARPPADVLVAMAPVLEQAGLFERLGT